MPSISYYLPIKLNDEFASLLEGRGWVPVVGAFGAKLNGPEKIAAEGAWVRALYQTSVESRSPVRLIEKEERRIERFEGAKRYLSSLAELAVPADSDLRRGASWFTLVRYASVSVPPPTNSECEGCDSGEGKSDLYAAGARHGGVGLAPVVSEIVRNWGVPYVNKLLDQCPQASGLFCNLAVLELAFPQKGHQAFENLRLLPGSLLNSRATGPAKDAADHAAHTLGVIATCPEFCDGWHGGLAPHVVWVAGVAPSSADLLPSRTRSGSVFPNSLSPVAPPAPPDPGVGAEFQAFYRALCRAIHGDHEECLDGGRPCLESITEVAPRVAPDSDEPGPDINPNGSGGPHSGTWLGLAAGDVLLVEAQLDVEVVVDGGATRIALLPVDLHPKVWRLVRQATDKGVLVVLPSGNSGEDLDTIHTMVLSDGSRMDLGLSEDENLVDTKMENFDSGALLVSCVDVCLKQFVSGDHDSPLYVDHFCSGGISSKGDRVDCFSWGNKVKTVSGNWPSKKGEKFDLSYTTSYGGTSSASAIIAAAASVLQASYRFAMFNTRVMSPERLRGLLSAKSLEEDTGIGVHPDIEKIFKEVIVPIIAGRSGQYSHGGKVIDFQSGESVGEIWSQAVARIRDGEGVANVQDALDRIALSNPGGLTDLYPPGFRRDPLWPPRGPAGEGGWTPPGGGTGLLVDPPDVDIPRWEQEGFEVDPNWGDLRDLQNRVQPPILGPSGPGLPER